MCLCVCVGLFCYSLPTYVFVTRCDQKESTNAAVGPSGKERHQREFATVRNLRSQPDAHFHLSEDEKLS